MRKLTYEELEDYKQRLTITVFDLHECQKVLNSTSCENAELKARIEKVIETLKKFHQNRDKHRTAYQLHEVDNFHYYLIESLEGRIEGTAGSSKESQAGGARLMVAPNHYDCEGCSAWDEVNGCWNDCRAYCGKNCISGTEDGPTQDYEEDCEEDEVSDTSREHDGK